MANFYLNRRRKIDYIALDRLSCVLRAVGNPKEVNTHLYQSLESVQWPEKQGVNCFVCFYFSTIPLHLPPPLPLLSTLPATGGDILSSSGFNGSDGAGLGQPRGKGLVVFAIHCHLANRLFLTAKVPSQQPLRPSLSLSFPLAFSTLRKNLSFSSSQTVFRIAIPEKRPSTSLPNGIIKRSQYNLWHHGMKIVIKIVKKNK